MDLCEMQISEYLNEEIASFAYKKTSCHFKTASVYVSIQLVSL